MGIIATETAEKGIADNDSTTRYREPALVSIHDVMPKTLPSVAKLIDTCLGSGIDKLTLLVVPGLEWQPHQIDQLRNWADQGHQLAGHGWVHRCDRIIGLKHRLHSLLISRSVAEHLSLSSDDSVRLIERCAAWLDDHRLPHDGLYVPPAWALGRLSREQLQSLPFTMIETLSGVAWTATGRKQKLPLVGFEADTLLRQYFVSGFNCLNRASSQWLRRPLRISIHPQDHLLRLAESLHSTLASGYQAMHYSELGVP